MVTKLCEERIDNPLFAFYLLSLDLGHLFNMDTLGSVI